MQSVVHPVLTNRLSHKAAHGFLWLFAQTIAGKAITMLGQVVLAWYLTPEDFGKIGTAMLIAAVGSIVQQTGGRAILIHRQAHFRRWASPSFSFSLAAGLLSAGIMLSIGIAVSMLKHEPMLVPIVAILAVRGVFDAASILPQAFLQIQLRFKALSILNLIYAVSTTTLGVVMALLGWRAMGYVTSFAIGSALLCFSSWAVAGVPLPATAQFRRWRFLLSDSGWQLGSAAATTALTQGDYLSLAALRSDTELGNYYYAYNLSTQTVQLITGNLGQVLFPTLAQLKDEPARQTQAFISAAEVLALVTFPCCFLQALWAGPLLTFLYRNKWNGAIVPLQILSIGMAFLLMSTPAVNLFMAQGRFRAFFWWSIFCAFSFLTFTATGAVFGGAVTVATAVTMFNAIFGPMGTWFAIKLNGGRLSHLITIYVRPMLACLFALGISILAIKIFTPFPVKSFSHATCTTLLGCAFYCLFAVLFSRPAVNNFANRLRLFLA